MTRDFLLAEVIKCPEQLKNLTLGDWHVLIRQGRYTGLLARLYQLVRYSDFESQIPVKVLRHLYSAQVVVDKQQDGLRCEFSKLLGVFTNTEIPVVVLKGAAYFAWDLPFANSRMLSDIDLLVPKKALAEVEADLHKHGWSSQSKDDYDEHYYREWMHEIPPLSHYKRRSVLDVHHTILPPTANYRPDPKKLLKAIVEVRPGIWTLCPEDMIIHSATHLFHEGEFDHGLRDLVDIKALLGYFSENEPGFWDRLVSRAIELDLIRPLYYGLHYAQEILAAEIPETVMQDAQKGAPNPIMKKVMDWLFLRALRPDHPSCDLPGTGLARWLLYVRSHYLRMPFYLLIPHLVRKAWKRRFDKPDTETAAV